MSGKRPLLGLTAAHARSRVRWCGRRRTGPRSCLQHTMRPGRGMRGGLARPLPIVSAHSRASGNPATGSPLSRDERMLAQSASSRPLLLTVGRFHLIGRLQSLDHRLDALGKAFRIEVQRIVVAVGNIGIERGMIGRNEPVLRAHAGDHVEQRKPVVLRRRESRIGALRIVVAAVAGRAPRLNQFDVQEETLQRAGEIRRLLEFRLAPGISSS